MTTEPRSTPGLTGPRFLNLCYHLPLYGGAVAHSGTRQREESGETADTLAVLRLNPDLEVS